MQRAHMFQQRRVAGRHLEKVDLRAETCLRRLVCEEPPLLLQPLDVALSSRIPSEDVPCGRRLRRLRRRGDSIISNATAGAKTLLDADVHVGCTAVGGRHHNSGRGRRLLHRRGNAARRAIRRRLVAITSTKSQKAPFAQHSNEGAMMNQSLTRIRECARATNVHAQDMRIARVRHVKVKVKLPSTRG